MFVAAAALTLVPALCRLGGRKLLPRAVRRNRPMRSAEPLTARWAARVGRRPLGWALASLGVLLVLAAPVLDLRTWPGDASSQPAAADHPSGLRPGRRRVRAGRERSAHRRGAHVHRWAPPATWWRTLRADARIARVEPVVTTPDGALSIITAEPSVRSHRRAHARMIDDLRADLPRGAEVTGWTPFFSDISAMLQHRLWLVIAFVVGVSVLLLGLMFRSVLVPLKAAVMNLLSISAAYGVLVAVFQWGWGAELIGVDRADAGVELDADPAVRDPVRALDGLRGVPALADPGGLPAHR